MHSLVFTMRLASADVPFDWQNLWIIDERLTFHSFLFSDKPLASVDVVQDGSDSRPGILIFNRALAFGEGEQPLTSLVVIEFKRPMRDAYRDEDPVSQVYRLVREIRSGQSEDNGRQLIRPLTQNVPAYCYIICDLTAPLEVRLQNMSALRMPDNLGYYGYNPTLNAYYEVISYTKLLQDAKKRNRILFDKLNLPIMQWRTRESSVGGADSLASTGGKQRLDLPFSIGEGQPRFATELPSWTAGRNHPQRRYALLIRLGRASVPS